MRGVKAANRHHLTQVSLVGLFLSVPADGRDHTSPTRTGEGSPSGAACRNARSLPARLAKVPGECDEVVEIHVAVPVEIPDQPG